MYSEIKKNDFRLLLQNKKTRRYRISVSCNEKQYIERAFDFLYKKNRNLLTPNTPSRRVI